MTVHFLQFFGHNKIDMFRKGMGPCPARFVSGWVQNKVSDTGNCLSTLKCGEHLFSGTGAGDWCCRQVEHSPGTGLFWFWLTNTMSRTNSRCEDVGYSRMAGRISHTIRRFSKHGRSFSDVPQLPDRCRRFHVWSLAIDCQVQMRGSCTTDLAIGAPHV